jgi:hypothetical protein
MEDVMSRTEIFEAVRGGHLPADFTDWGLTDENGDSVADWAVVRPETSPETKKAAEIWLKGGSATAGRSLSESAPAAEEPEKTADLPQKRKRGKSVAMPKDSVTVAEGDRTRIEDTFGEKIGGSRRDIRRQFDSGDFSLEGFDELDIKEVRKLAVIDRLWPEPDWGEYSTMPLRSLRARLLRDALPKACPNGMDVGRYIRFVTDTRENVDKFAKCFDDGEALREEWRIEKIIGIDEFGDRWFGLPSGLSTIHKRKIFNVFSQSSQNYFDNDLKSLAGWPDKTDSLFLDGYKPYKHWDGKIVVVNNKGRVASRMRFDTGEECIDYINNGFRAELSAKRSSSSAGNDDRVNPVRPMLANINRDGPDYGISEVTPEIFQETFGFRGGEFGTWLTQEDRKQSLRMAYDAFMDLANLLGVDPKRIGDGRLGFAFGARGAGKYAAHFEPDKVVINLTKLKGAGAVAHEWAHFLDFSNGGGRRNSQASGTMDWLWKRELLPEERTAARREEVKTILDHLEGWVRNKNREQCPVIMTELRSLDPVSERFENLFKETVKAYAGTKRNKEAFVLHYWRLRSAESCRYGKTGFYTEAAKLDTGRAKAYWSQETELFARAFEAFVVRKMADAGVENEYLATLYEHPTAKVYPTTEEMEQMTPRIEEFLNQAARVSAGEENEENLSPAPSASG